MLGQGFFASKHSHQKKQKSLWMAVSQVKTSIPSSSLFIKKKKKVDLSDEHISFAIIVLPQRGLFNRVEQRVKVSITILQNK